MKKIFWLVGAGLLGLAGFAYSQLSNSTQRPCGESGAMAEILMRDYDESLILHGTVDGGKVLSLWASKNTKSWTILLSSGTTSCYITSGTNLKFAGNPI